jgi:hypothetical protein
VRLEHIKLDVLQKLELLYKVYCFAIYGNSAEKNSKNILKNFTLFFKQVISLPKGCFEILNIMEYLKLKLKKRHFPPRNFYKDHYILFSSNKPNLNVDNLQRRKAIQFNSSIVYCSLRTTLNGKLTHNIK